MVRAVRPGGPILDLQVIRPNPRVELGDELICEIDGRPLFDKADAAVDAVDAMAGSGRLLQEAIDDHDDFKDTARRISEEAIPRLRAITRPLLVREHCRLRRLTVA